MPKKLAYRQNKSFLTLNLLVRKKDFINLLMLKVINTQINAISK